MKQLYFTWLCLVLCLSASAQGNLLPDGKDSLLSHIPGQYLKRVRAKTSQVENFIDRRTNKALKQMERLETRMQKKLEKADPQRAVTLFGPASGKISNLKEKLISGSKQTGIGSGYIDNYTDSLESSLKFLQGAGLGSLTKGKNIEAVQKSVAAIKDKMQLSESLQADLAERKRQLMQGVSGLAGFKKLTGKYSKQVSYYKQQIDDFKEMLHDPSRAERKAAELLRKSNIYQDFLKKNPILAGLFNINMNEDPAQALQYLQTRTFVENRIQQGIGSDPAARQAVSQQMERSSSLIDEAKSKLPGGSGNVGDLPEHNLNPMKTKRFLQRLEFGTDIQSQQSNTLLPTMTDISLQAGYKFNPKLNAGIGLAYKIGWGKSLSHFTISSEGIGFRSFANYKVAGRFHATAGLEYNHFSRFSTVNELKNWNGWTKSTLAGVKVMLNENSRPKASMILLYDFQARRTIPQSSALKLRYQYNF